MAIPEHERFKHCGAAGTFEETGLVRLCWSLAKQASGKPACLGSQECFRAGEQARHLHHATFRDFLFVALEQHLSTPKI